MAKKSSDTLILGYWLIPGKLGVRPLDPLLLGELVPVNERLIDNCKFGGSLETGTVGDDVGNFSSLTIGKEDMGGLQELLPLFFWS